MTGIGPDQTVFSQFVPSPLCARVANVRKMSKPRKHYNGFRARWTDENGKRCSQTCPTFAEAASVQRARENEVDEIKRARIGLNPKTVANHLTLLGSMLTLAVELGWLARPPRIKNPRIEQFSQDFRYLRTTADIDRFLASAHQHNNPCVPVLYSIAVYRHAGRRIGLAPDAFERDYARLGNATGSAVVLPPTSWRLGSSDDPTPKGPGSSVQLRRTKTPSASPNHYPRPPLRITATAEVRGYRQNRRQPPGRPSIGGDRCILKQVWIKPLDKYSLGRREQNGIGQSPCLKKSTASKMRYTSWAPTPDTAFAALALAGSDSQITTFVSRLHANAACLRPDTAKCYGQRLST